jgi:hypothetical protein
MTVDDFRAVGGIAGSIEQEAEATFFGLDERGRRIARVLFGHLLDSSGRTRGTRPVDRRELVARVGDEVDGDVDRVLKVFADRRLLTVRDTTVEISYEVLVDSWPRLRGWIEAAQRRRGRIAPPTNRSRGGAAAPARAPAWARLGLIRAGRR